MKALILTCNNQYNILTHFVNGIVQDLKLMGIQADTCSMSSEQKDELNDDPIGAKQYAFCLSINGVGLDLNFEGKGNFTDYTGKPTLVYLVDHPIHLFKRFYGKKVSLLCVDQEHVAFANMIGVDAHYFPHAVATNNSERPESIAFEDKDETLLFPASYFPLKKWEDLLKPLWGKIGSAIENATSVTRFMQFVGILPYGNRAPTMTLDETVLTTCKAVDFYLRAKSRMSMLQTFQDAQIQLTVLGQGVDAYKEQYSFHQYEQASDFAVLLPRIKRAKFLVHNSPGFERGLHDRLVIAMNEKTAVISNNTPYANDVFKLPGGIVSNIEKTALGLKNDEYDALVTSNYQQIQSEHTWQKRFSQLLR